MLTLAGETLLLDIEEIRGRRESLGLTMEQAAAAGGIGTDTTRRQAWYMFESGRRADITLTMVTKIAKALRCHPKDLLREDK